VIISRTPLRISLGGGGTDIPSFYEKNGGGFLIAAGITKYVYVSIHENFVDRILLKYSKIEDVDSIDSIEHPLVREALKLYPPKSGVEITSLADIPAGTGLGSSGTFTVGLLKALLAHQRRLVSNSELAEIACRLEIEILGEPVGKQDQYIAALGGLTAIEFLPDGSVKASEVKIPPSAREQLEDNLLLFFTGIRRSASQELASLSDTTDARNESVSENLREVRDIGRESAKALESSDLEAFADLMNNQWRMKLHRAPSQIHQAVDSWIQAGLNCGALGGKLVGAGGGGFLLFYAEDKGRLKKEMSDLGLKEVKFSFDYEGSVLL
jgi:D-glycero-alpha-D-manno-heptose-7-phosphate kinase